MDNPIDSPLDLGLVNYVKHPSNQNYIVFRFADDKRAVTFEGRLIEGKIWFEKGSETRRTKEYFLFGVHKNDFKKVSKINFDVEAKHKKPFIPFKAFRYFMLLFSAAVLTIAIMGYCEQQKKLNSYNENGLLINHEAESK